jgi:hypothetical protein
MRTVTFVVAATSLLAVGCSRKHLSPAHAQATRQAFAMQRATPAKPPPPPNMALDTQEAQVIAKSYVKSLAGKTGGAEPEPVLYLSPQRQGAPAQLAPSVPKE